MIVLGEYLSVKSINKADVSRKIGVSKFIFSELSRKETAKLKANEVYLIALAIDVPLEEILKNVCGHLKLIKLK